MTLKQNNQAKPWFSGEPFERLITLLIALVTLLAAVAGYLQVQADGESSNAQNESQQFALQAIGGRARGEILAGYSWSDAYRTWLELDTQAVLAQNNLDQARAQDLLTTRNQIATLTPLLQPPYFDATAQDYPDLRAYEADLYVQETAALHEFFANADAVSAAWGDKSAIYVINLTLFTVALFLFALSITVAKGINWLFVILGSVMALATTIWMIRVVLTPVAALPKLAIEAYAAGVGLAHEEEYSAAERAFDRAIQFAPDYANALYERANVRYKLNQFKQAADDYQAALLAGREDANLFWNAGWTAYRAGDFALAMAHTDQALQRLPDQIALYFNLALTQLASGDFAKSEASYTFAATLVQQQVTSLRSSGKQPPVSLWWYLDTAALDLRNLGHCIEQKACDGAPPLASIATDAKVAQVARWWQQKLQSLAVMLEYPELTAEIKESPASAATVSATVTDVTISTAVYDSAGALVAYQPLGETNGPLRFGMAQESQGQTMDTSLQRASGATNRNLFVNFKYDTIQSGELVVLKVYLNDREAAGLRQAFPWKLDQSGEAALPLNPGRTFTLAAGDYRVDIFVDGQFVQTATFRLS